MRANRHLTLFEKRQLSPSLMRLVFTGEDLKTFPVGEESGYVKLLFPADGEREVQGDKLDDKPYFKALHKRTFTIRQYKPEDNTLHIDGVCHSFGHPEQGPANAWIETAAPGHAIWVSGPGEKKLINAPSDWYFFVGDMTALPAIAVNLAQLEGDARGYAVIEVMSSGDIVELPRPDNLEVHWVINSDPKCPSTYLAQAARERPWQEGVPSVWVAGEFELMRDLRKYFKRERSVPKSQVYASSYWKIGESDEGNKRAKKQDELIAED
ncbi:siderophore-interacting protein [Halioxenophilus aromaticivorans]|uniref:Siderophore-interacting protein n=1 Tax=Halioxenophilus aromaticivorans TaxID=1306992 RepID=A0AAV3U427_9ALTE